jgi:hypothetical protein
MTFAFADPPYLGTALHSYGKFHDRAADYDDPETHRTLIQSLHDTFPDGWALSASMLNLWDLLPMIPKAWGCRIAAWCAPFGALSKRNWPQRCWEPVIFCGGRERGRNDVPARDYLVANKQCAAPGHRGINHHTPRPTKFPGRKPDEFCYWLFELLNMREGDTFVDLFPGTGRVTRAWEVWRRRNMILFPLGMYPGGSEGVGR